MSSTAIITMTKMMENLPEPTQDRMVERLRTFLADMQDDAEWNKLFAKTETGLVAAAQQAKQEIAAGLAQPMNFDRL